MVISGNGQMDARLVMVHKKCSFPTITRLKGDIYRGQVEYGIKRRSFAPETTQGKIEAN